MSQLLLKKKPNIFSKWFDSGFKLIFLLNLKSKKYKKHILNENK